MLTLLNTPGQQQGHCVKSASDNKGIAEVLRNHRAALTETSPDDVLVRLLTALEQIKDKKQASLTREFAILRLAALIRSIRERETWPSWPCGSGLAFAAEAITSSIRG